MTPEKSPENFGWLTYAWVFGLSAMGGLVSFMRKVKDGHARAWNIVELIGEVCTATHCGDGRHCRPHGEPFDHVARAVHGVQVS